MEHFTFEGDLQALTDSQFKLVESVLQKRGFKNGKVLVEPVGQKGDNYVAHVKRFTYEANDKSTFKMIGKIAPVVEELRKLMRTPLLFKNEIIMYNVVLPKFDNIQNSAGVTEDEKVRFPVCYGVVTEAPFEFILLEDLKESGFEMLDRSQPLSSENVRLVLKDLARYHSLSYVFKNTEPETFKDVVGKMFNMWASMDDPESKEFLEMTESDVIRILYDSSEKYKKAINGSFAQLGVIARKLESYEENSKYSVIQQGDCWNNNILFRLEDDQPVQNVMIDYQLSRQSNPASDILYLIFNCTDHASRLEHYHEWIDYYHEILDDSLSNHGLKANLIFPKDQLDADLRRYGRTMVNVCVMIALVLIRESKDAVDFKEVTGVTGDIMEDTKSQLSASSLGASTIVKFKERITDIIDTALEFGLLSL